MAISNAACGENVRMSYISELEILEEKVSDWAVDLIMDIYNLLCPDGRPYNWVEQDMDEQLNEYQLVRGDPQAWAKKILDDATAISQKLLDSGLRDDQIVSVHPFDIAQKFALEYSINMEKEIAKRAGINY